MKKYFSGKDPRAQGKTRVARAQSAAEINNFVGSNFSTVAPGVPVCACAFGTARSEGKVAKELFATTPVATKASEAIGEAGALHYLKQTLAAQGIKFDKKNLFVFNGANAFNMVYFDAAPPNATKAIVLEAKGGSSTLGSRLNYPRSAPVKQSTKAYANTITQVMIDSPDDKRADVGLQLKKLQNGTPPKILYAGVATKYDKSAKKVHNPVPIFATKL